MGRAKDFISSLGQSIRPQLLALGFVETDPNYFFKHRSGKDYIVYQSGRSWIFRVFQMGHAWRSHNFPGGNLLRRVEGPPAGVLTAIKGELS
jgi:hypothetical protein